MQVSIMSERNSGSHFLKYALLFNFDIKFVDGNKHWFGHAPLLENTIYICIIRHPVDWVDSLFKRLHHIPPENKNIHSFLNNEWYSIYEQGPLKNTEILQDRNMLTKERYKNIFEMRKMKNDYLLQNGYVINYEDLRDHYEETLTKIAETFHFKRKQSYWVPVPKMKGTFNELYKRKPILISQEIQQYVTDKIDLEQEKRIGYYNGAT